MLGDYKTELVMLMIFVCAIVLLVKAVRVMMGDITDDDERLD